MIRMFLAVLAAISFGSMATAQGAQVAFGGLKHDSTLPVEISAESLEIDQASGAAVFKGNVLIGQGEMRLTANLVNVTYAATGTTNSGEIERLDATGGVTLVSGAEMAEAQSAVYTIDSSNIVMTGDVILTQGENALSGDRLDIDLDTGKGTITGRVRVIFKSGAKN